MSTLKGTRPYKDNPELLQELITMRKTFSIGSIAEKHRVSPHTVDYWCRVLKLPQPTLHTRGGARQQTGKAKTIEGKTYQEYLNKPKDTKSDENFSEFWNITERFSEVFTCECGTRYIQTRGKEQNKCLFCLGHAEHRNKKVWL